MRRWALLLLFLIPVQAGATTRPPELSPVIHAAEPYGSGDMTWLRIPVYDASLWTDARNWSMESAFALTLDYHMSIKSNALVERTIEEMERQPGFDAERRDYASELATVFPDVKDGDRITALYQPGEAVRFFHNAKYTGSMESKDFAQAFFGIWLGESTSEPEIRKKLLKLSSRP